MDPFASFLVGPYGKAFALMAEYPELHEWLQDN
jgi:hypothetical protein